MIKTILEELGPGGLFLASAVLSFVMFVATIKLLEWLLEVPKVSKYEPPPPLDLTEDEKAELRYALRESAKVPHEVDEDDLVEADEPCSVCHRKDCWSVRRF